MPIARIVTALVLFAAVVHAQEKFPARIPMIEAEIFGIDRSHSVLDFTIGFMGLTKVRGTFNNFTATILFDEVKPERSSVTLSIDAASIDTNSEWRDKDLQGAPWFDVAKHPKIVFQSKRIERKGENRYVVHGDLTIKGVTRAIAIPMTHSVPRGPDPGWGNIRIGGTGAVTLNRRELGIEGPEFWSKALADTVDVEIDLLGNRPNYERRGFPPGDKPPVGELLAKTIETDGGAAAAAQFKLLRAEKADEYRFGPGQLQVLIQRLMQHRKIDDALALLAVATEAYPEEPEFYARSGEAHAARGDRAKAIAAYEKAQALDPEGTEAKEMLRRLR
jgi:polyisoprenoid-binding protein YceI